MRKSFRLFAVAATAVIGAGAMAMFTGCTSDYPEVTITYEFEGTEYEVAYTLSRTGAPSTVQHFIELAETGYYNGTVIHDYQSNALYGGGYTWDPQAENGEGGLVEKDYWAELRKYEQENDYTFTQTVFAKGADMASALTALAAEGGSYTAGGKTYTAADTEIPLYTVYGEFSANGVTANSKTYTHGQKGVLVMYYTGNGDDPTRVATKRADGGENNKNEAGKPVETQQGSSYKTNCATSLFYTWTSASGGSTLDANYAAFGLVKDFAQMQALLDAISDYITEKSSEDAEYSFTQEEHIRNVNQYDPIDRVRNAGISAEYEVPKSPITIKSVTVDKY